MGQVSAASTILINVGPEATLAAVADYQKVRPKILSPQYSEYQVLQGGHGAGTVLVVLVLVVVFIGADAPPLPLFTLIPLLPALYHLFHARFYALKRQ